MTWPSGLDAMAVLDIVRRALMEDVGTGDVTTAAAVGAGQQAHGIVMAKSSCVIAGLEIAAHVFRQTDPDVSVLFRRADGDSCEVGDVVAELHGRARAMLTAERTALNLLQRLSGIATLTRRFVDAAAGRIIVMDTRKTTPTLRVIEKYAVRAGGGTNHRMGLDEGILIKDNHIRLAGGLGEAVRRVRAAGSRLPIEVEAQNLEQVEEAIDAGAATILLDNLTTGEIRTAVARIAGRAKVELSGGITLERVPDLAATGADYVSVGALTHSAPAADLSLEIAPSEAC